VDAPTDERLLQEHLHGRTASFELLVRRYTAELFQFAQRVTGDSMAAEDVVQETLLQVHQSGASFDLGRRFKPWLFTIAANKARDHLRRRNRRKEVSFEAQVGNEDEVRQRFIDLFSAAGDLPDDDVTVEEKRRIVRDIVEDMPDKLREVLVLAYYHHFPYKDVGVILDVPLGTVKSRLHAAVVWFGERYRQNVTEKAKEGS